MDWRHRHNYPTGDMCREDLGELDPREYYAGGGRVTEDEFEDFDELVPYGEYGIHTIVSIEIIEVASVKKLL